MKNWKNITLELLEYNLDDAFNKISHLDVLSVSIKDKRTSKESDWFDDPEKTSTINQETHSIVILIEEEKSTQTLIKNIQQLLNFKEEIYFEEELFEDRDWVKHTQSLFKEISISDSLRILPHWVKKKKFNGTTILIDPGTGFGTGSHATTKLCLRWIEDQLKKNRTVLDFGSGSGILSIAVKKLTNNSINGVEIDELAIKNALHNNSLNDVRINYILSTNFDLNQKFDVVISNILANTLISLSEKFKKVTKDELLLSGILNHQVKNIISKYESWIELKLISEEDGWCLLHGKLKS